MKSLICGVIVAIVIMGVSGSAMATELYSSTLDGSQEIPTPIVTNASGTATLSLSKDDSQLMISIQLNNLDLDGNQTPGDPNDDVVAMHIHRAPAGVNGPVVFGFISPNNDMDGDLVIDAAAGTVVSEWDTAEGNGTTLAAELANLRANGLYFNVHTTDNGGGEIRGQIIFEETIPTVTEWGLIILTLLLLTAGTIVFGRHRKPALA